MEKDGKNQHLIPTLTPARSNEYRQVIQNQAKHRVYVGTIIHKINLEVKPNHSGFKKLESSFAEKTDGMYTFFVGNKKFFFQNIRLYFRKKWSECLFKSQTTYIDATHVVEFVLESKHLAK